MTPEMQAMLAATTFAVVGASRDHNKYGYQVYHALQSSGRAVFPVNPNTAEIEGNFCYPTLSDLPQIPEVAVMIVPPKVTEAAVAECASLGIGQIWMQPGAESAAAVAACRNHKIAVVAGGPCLLVLLGTAGDQPQ